MKTEAQPVFHPTLGASIPEAGWVPAPRYLLRRSRVIHYMKSLNPNRFLDIGCGPGALLADAARLGIQAEGFEMAESARRLGARILEGLDIPIHDGPSQQWAGLFDLVGAFEVLEHIEDDQHALNEWREWVAPGKHLMLSVPAHPSRFNAADVWAGHYRRYTRKRLETLFQEAGFKIEALECYGFPLATILEWPRAWVYGRQLRKANANPESGSAERTAQSGTNRSVDSRFWPFLASPLGTAMIQLFAWLQKPFMKTALGNGYLVVARKI